MRPEMREYNMDWMVASMLQVASRLTTCTDKEWKRMLRYMPYFKVLLETSKNAGEPGLYLFKMLNAYFERLMTARANQQKICMTTFCFCPIILESFHVAPLMVEMVTAFLTVMYKRGASDYMDYCLEEGYSETGCSSQRGTMGAYLAGMGEKLDFVVGSMGGVCDSNCNAYAFIAERLKLPIYTLNYPADITNQDVRDYQRKDYYALIDFLEKQTGQLLDEDRLRTLLTEKTRQDAIVNEIEEMQMLIPNPVKPIYLLLIYSGNLMCPGSPIYTEMLKKIRNVVRNNADNGISGSSSGKENCRTVFFYIDHTGFGLSFWRWLDQHGIAHLGGVPSRSFSETAPYVSGIPGTCYHIDTSNMDTMIDSLIDINATMPMTRTIRGPYDAPHMWLMDTLSICELYQADSCVYAGTPGCRNTWSNVKLMVQELEKAGYPTHIMYSDSFDLRVENWETTSARLEEFYHVRGLLKEI
jgi:hypothetical protein